MKRTFAITLLLVALLLSGSIIAPSGLGAQGDPPIQETVEIIVTPEPLQVISLGAFANANQHAVAFNLVGDTVVSVYTDGTNTWQEERTVLSEVSGLSLAVCGTRAYVFLLAPDGYTEIVSFDLQSAFPCTPVRAVFLPLVIGGE